MTLRLEAAAHVWVNLTGADSAAHSQGSFRHPALRSGPDSARELLLYVDNVSLVKLVSGFEHAAGYDVPGQYAGLVLDHFKFGDLTAYLAGQPDSTYWAARGVIALLGCDCGEVGCWPLEARVLLDDDWVTWAASLSPTVPSATTGLSAPSGFGGASTSVQFVGPPLP